MVNSMVHRGPDGQGSVRFGPFTLAMRRLAIIDIECGDQPIFNEDRTIAVVCNGEIYNYQCLRTTLEHSGHQFRSGADIEVIVHAYEEWGHSALDHFNGMFALAICDNRKGEPELFLARDRMGIKPLYYFHDGNQFLFASETRTLLASGHVPQAVDEDSIRDYLAFQSAVTPRTMIRGVSMLPPGATLTVSATGEITLDRFFSLEDSIGATNRRWNRTNVVAETRRLIFDAVESHLVADVPVGVFLSGGVDSSTIASMIRALGHQPVTFTVGFGAADSAIDERATATAFARSLNADHTEIVIDEESCLDAVLRALEAADHPSGDGINAFLVAGAVANAGFKVALSGLGADELFGGYSTFKRMRRFAKVAPILRQLPQVIRKALALTTTAPFPQTVQTDKFRALMTCDSEAEAHSILRQMFLPNERAAILHGNHDQRYGFTSDLYSAISQPAFATRQLESAISIAEMRTYMQDVLLRDTDQMSMAHGLEVRVPFLDHRLAAFVLGLPNHLKIGGHGPKHLLKAAVEDLVPWQRRSPNKMGFVLPWDRWLRGPLHNLAFEHLQRLGKRSLFRETGVLDVWRRFENRDRRITWSRVWTLVALESWLARHLPDAGH